MAESDRAGELLEKIEGRAAQCAVVGLGMVGTMQVRLLLKAGFSVVGYDVDESIVDQRRVELSDPGVAQISTKEFVLQDADVVFVCVRVGLLSGGKPNFQALGRVCKSIESQCRQQALVVLVTTVPLGTTSWVAKEINAGFGPDGSNCSHLVGFAPERITADQLLDDVIKTPRLVTGVGSVARELTAKMMTGICDEVVPVSSPEVAEMTKLLENTFRTHCIALIGEMTRAAGAWGIEATEVCEAAATKPYGYFPFYPGPGVGGHCLPNDLRLLEFSCSHVGQSSSLLSSVREAIEFIPAGVIDRLEGLMSSPTSSPMMGAKVLLVGVGFKPGSSDTTASPAGLLAEVLLDRGAHVSYLDSNVGEFAVRGKNLERVDAVGIRRWDAIVIVSGDPLVPLETLNKASSLVLDTGGAALMKGDKSRLARL